MCSLQPRKDLMWTLCLTRSNQLSIEGFSDEELMRRLILLRYIIIVLIVYHYVYEIPKKILNLKNLELECSLIEVEYKWSVGLPGQTNI